MTGQRRQNFFLSVLKKRRSVRRVESDAGNSSQTATTSLIPPLNLTFLPPGAILGTYGRTVSILRRLAWPPALKDDTLEQRVQPPFLPFFFFWKESWPLPWVIFEQVAFVVAPVPASSLSF